jgi:uncharacterized protein YbjT (DUF2867 family)
MTSSILLTGGTGTLGRLVTPLLRDAGCKVRVLSRHNHKPGHSNDAGHSDKTGHSHEGRDGIEAGDGVEFVRGDLATGEGIEAAVDGVDTILHCAGSPKGDGDKARNLVRAVSRVGAPHLVYISVVGAERVPVVSGVDRAMFGYFAAKRDGERIVAESGLPWTTLRATQFHDLVLTMARQLAKMPVIPAPVGRMQPIDAGEVATRLVELSLGKPAGLVPDIAGPHVYEVKELIRSYLRATHRRRLIMPVRLPGQAARAYRAGANLAPDRAVGHRTWEDFLADQLHAAR